jgi:hypothetical protein
MCFFYETWGIWSPTGILLLKYMNVSTAFKKQRNVKKKIKQNTSKLLAIDTLFSLSE